MLGAVLALYYMRSMDRVGNRFGKLVVTARGSQYGHWVCRCDCGAVKSIHVSNLLREATVSCGCARPGRITKHGHAIGGMLTPTYRTWREMKTRCLNAANPNYPMYGGRGITICKRWLEFSVFLEDMGARPAGTSIDRIDNNGNYEPGNCRWATAKQQANNRRRRRDARITL